MKKAVASFVAGVLLTIGATTFADGIESLIGKRVEGETVVTVDGASIGSAIIVDGKSYAPVRSIAEASGLSVGYGGAGIALNTNKEVVTEVQTSTIVEPTNDDNTNIKKNNMSLSSIEKAIKSNEDQIIYYEAGIERQNLLIDQGRDVEVNKTILDYYEKSKAEATK